VNIFISKQNNLYYNKIIKRDDNMKEKEKVSKLFGMFIKIQENAIDSAKHSDIYKYSRDSLYSIAIDLIESFESN